MKLYVGNLPFTVDEGSLKKLFESYETEEITLIVDKFSKRSKGFGFVTIADDAVAKKAIEEMNGKDVEGRELKISEAKPQEDRPRREFNNGPRRDNNFGGGNHGRNNNNRRF